jgi:hypothetical protein
MSSSPKPQLRILEWLIFVFNISALNKMLIFNLFKTPFYLMIMIFWVLALCRLVGRWPTLSSTDESTQRQNPEEHHPHRRGNKKSHAVLSTLLHLVFYG